MSDPVKYFLLGVFITAWGIAFGILGTADREAEAAGLITSPTCISIMLMDGTTTSTTPIECYEGTETDGR